MRRASSSSASATGCSATMSSRSSAQSCRRTDAADVAHPLLGREAPCLEPGLHFLSGDEFAIIAELGGRIVNGFLGTLLVDGIKMRLTGEALAGFGLKLVPATAGLCVQHHIAPMKDLAIDGEDGAV